MASFVRFDHLGHLVWVTTKNGRLRYFNIDSLGGVSYRRLGESGYTVQSSGVFIVFIPEKTQKSRRLNSVIQATRW